MLWYWTARFSWSVLLSFLQPATVLLLLRSLRGTVNYELECVPIAADRGPTMFVFQQSHCCHHIGPIGVNCCFYFSRQDVKSATISSSHVIMFAPECLSSRGMVAKFKVSLFANLQWWNGRKHPGVPLLHDYSRHQLSVWGSFGLHNGLLHLFKYNTFSSAETHTVYTVQQTLNISYIIAAILCFNQDRIMDQQSEIFSSWTVSYQIQMWCTQCTNWLMQWWRSLAGEYTSAFLRRVMHGCITGFDIKQHICQEKE